jgi:hypothetical protein
MAISSLFSVSGLTDVQAYPIAYDATATFVIQSLTGITSISWSIVGTSKSTQAAITITPAGTPTGATATAVMPADPGDGLGRAFAVKLTVSNANESSTTYRVFGAANSAGIIPAVANEELWRHATHGWTDIFNQCLNAIGGAAGATTQLLYNNAGAIDGASGITVVGSETGLSLAYIQASTGTVPTNGLVRGANNVSVAVAANAAGSSILLGYVSDADILYIGRAVGAFVAPANAEYNVATAGTHTFSIAGTAEVVLGATALDLNGNHLQEVGDFDHDGTNFGVYGTTPIAKQTGVAVTAGGVHAALVALGFISA